MIIERPGRARGHAEHGWLDSRHTFSFGHYHDPRWMGFGALRVINEDRVAPGGGFAPHRHANMEIISVVLEGALAHKDSTGGEGVLRPGEVQWMSAGHGVEHSEYNGDPDQTTHFLQIWIQPDRVNAAPAYEQRAFERQARRGKWDTFASFEGRDGGLPIRQDAALRAVALMPGEQVEAMLDAARGYWLHIARGEVKVAGERTLRAGDALGFVDEAGALSVEGAGDGEAEVLLFDLPR
ncbi:pirin family protein [Lysobacter pythonis]|uniref:Pirin family protein n=1 Tax=Solilutibacter pythonis TaxID=2483112 RepID=A0A3M2HZ48_9GAMM|nr:pirin family protein [Lysobacter pythonis]RMH93123.1 pirin family protein [Lysobacter pythonis]